MQWYTSPIWLNGVLRSVVIPYRLPWFRPIHSLYLLITPTERRQPWKLYLTPGLLMAQSINALIGLRVLLSPDLYVGGSRSPVRFGLYMAVEILSVAVCCPLQVMITKLAVQRNHTTETCTPVATVPGGSETADAQEYTEASGIPEDVIECVPGIQPVG